jgi:hypothetical protein
VISATISVTVTCDTCGHGLTGDPARPVDPEPAVFPDRPAALAALSAAPGWARRLEGRLLCPRCASRALCLRNGHDYGDPESWRVCACDRSLPRHVDAPGDPTGGSGCGMEWRLCGRCDHIDERHVTDLARPAGGEHDEQDQPGGYIRQDIPAGLALPNHHEDSEETAMVGAPPQGLPRGIGTTVPPACDDVAGYRGVVVAPNAHDGVPRDADIRLVARDEGPRRWEYHDQLTPLGHRQVIS